MNLNNGPLTDKSKIDQLLAFGRRYCRNSTADHVLMEKRIKEAIDSAALIGYYSGVVEGYQILCLINMSMDAQDMALNALKMSEALISKYNLPQSSYLELYNTYVIYYMDYLGDKEQAVHMCRKGIELAQQLNDKQMLMKLKANLGTLYILFGDFHKAKELLEKALVYYQSHKDQHRKIFCMSNLGEAYIGCGDYEEAMAIYREVITMAIESNEDIIIEEATIGLGKLHRINDENNKAVKLLEDACEKLKHRHQLKLSVRLVLELIDLHLSMNNYIMADHHIKVLEEELIPGQNAEADIIYYRLKAAIAVGFGDYKLAYQMEKHHHDLYLENSDIKGKKALNNIATSQLRKTIERLEGIGNVGRKLTTFSAKDNTLMILYNELKSLMSLDTISVGILEGQRVNYATYQSDMKELSTFQTPISEEGFSFWCITHRKEMMINDINAEYSMYMDDFRRKMEGKGVKLSQSAIYIPLIVEADVIGLISVQSYKTLAYTTEDLETLKVIGSYVAIAVLNNKQAKKLKQLALTDQLTKLKNREGLAQAFNRLTKHRIKSISMIMLDLDHFKEVNDSFGHMAGDRVLNAFGKLLASYEDDLTVVAARQGGEEFALLLINHSTKKVEQIGKEILEQVRTLKLDLNEDQVVITVSAGIYHHKDGPQPSLDQLYRYSDRALYQAKDQGRDCINVYEA